MFMVPLKKLEEHHLKAFCDEGVGESDKTEFKQELSLSSPKERAEAAKDISAMSNGVGGRIYYGIAEKQLGDKTVVADKITPLTDGSLAERLENVIVETIHPVPRYEMNRVDIDSGGYVLVIEVYPSYSRDLHMVSGFKNFRFYRRGEYRTVPMSEPEIREAYFRIAASRYAIEEDMQRTILEGRERAASIPESVFIVPVYGRPNLIDPCQFGDALAGDLLGSNICHGILAHNIANIRVVSRGYEWVKINDKIPADLIGIYRNGVVHCATARNARTDKNDKCFSLFSMADFLAGTILIAKHVLGLAKYWGPVRICHILQSMDRFWLTTQSHQAFGDWLERQPGEYRQEVHEVTLSNPSELHAAGVELANQLFQMAGNSVCPWFDASGRIKEGMPCNFAWLLKSSE